MSLRCWIVTLGHHQTWHRLISLGEVYSKRREANSRPRGQRRLTVHRRILTHCLGLDCLELRYLSLDEVAIGNVLLVESSREVMMYDCQLSLELLRNLNEFIFKDRLHLCLHAFFELLHNYLFYFLLGNVNLLNI
jgi:hypothetical protein